MILICIAWILAIWQCGEAVTIHGVLVHCDTINVMSIYYKKPIENKYAGCLTVHWMTNVPSLLNKYYYNNNLTHV